MARSTVSTPRIFVRDTAVALLLLIVLYGFTQVDQAQALQIPGYLLIVGFDALEGLFGAAGSAYSLLFAAYLIGLGVIGAAVSSLLRRQSREARLTSWQAGMAGTLAVVGVISVLYGATISVGIPQLAPLVITGVSAIVLLALAGWLAGLFGPGIRHRSEG